MGNLTCVEMKGRVVDTIHTMDHLNCGHVRGLGVARLLVGFALLWSKAASGMSIGAGIPILMLLSLYRIVPP